MVFVSGCTPTQPYFFREDGDLSHYTNVATDVEYPDVNEPKLAEAEGALPPLTLANAENFKVWNLSLEEVTRITLANSQVMRQLGGRISDQGANIAQTTPTTLTSGANVATTYDPALVESGYGGNTASQFSGTGVEAALSEFDAQLNSSLTWRKNDRPQNFRSATFGNFFVPQFQQDQGIGAIGLNKTSAAGTTFSLRGNTNYDQNNNGSRQTPSDWFTNIEAGFSQPLLQGAGVQYNRIAGPRSFQEYDGGFADQFDGVMIARIRYDISLADFESGIRALMRDVEDAYWELYFAYRDLESRKSGRDSALATWQRVKELERVGGEGGEADKEAQARSQYYLFRAQVETALTTVFRQENRLRYLMGLAATDGQLIRPIDEPTTAHVTFDWTMIHSEGLVRRPELRKQKWQIKRRELELIASRNQLLPRLDAVGTYRWLGAGNDLLDSQRNGVGPFNPGSNAFQSLTSGDFQEWELGAQFSMPLGFRRGMTTVRNHQLLLAHERAILKDMELEVSHQVADAVRDIDLNFGVAQTNFNRRAAAEDEVEAVQAIYDVGKTTLDQLLDAQRRRSESESQYYRSLVDYNRAIMRLHFNKGSLLEYNGVYLAEGPWPGKAYFDALRRARQRDASLYLDYGYTRPSVVSTGQDPQFTGTPNGASYGGPVIDADQGSTIAPEPESTPSATPSTPEVNPTLPSEQMPAPPTTDPLSGTAPLGHAAADFAQALPPIDGAAALAVAADPPTIPNPPASGAPSVVPPIHQPAARPSTQVASLSLPQNPFLENPAAPLVAPTAALLTQPASVEREVNAKRPAQASAELNSGTSP